MVELNEIQKRLIQEVADLHEVPMGAYNFRANGGLAGRNRRTAAALTSISSREPSTKVCIFP